MKHSELGSDQLRFGEMGDMYALSCLYVYLLIFSREKNNKSFYDTTAALCPAPVNPDSFYLLVPAHPEKGPLNGCLCSCLLFIR